MRIRLRSVSAVVGLLLVLPLFAPTGAMAGRRRDARVERQNIEERARSQRGTPYRSGGTSPGGFDCSGFTRWVFSTRGPNLPHSSTRQFEMGKRPGYKRIWKRSKLEVGDLVFHDTGYGRVGHAGIYVGGGRFISSTTSGGVRVRSLTDSYWGPRWVGATRTPVTQR